jgi:hypothetical protein
MYSSQTLLNITMRKISDDPSKGRILKLGFCYAGSHPEFFLGGWGVLTLRPCTIYV